MFKYFTMFVLAASIHYTTIAQKKELVKKITNKIFSSYLIKSKGYSSADSNFLVKFNDPAGAFRLKNCKILRRINYNYFIVTGESASVFKLASEVYAANNMYKCSDNLLYYWMSHPNKSCLVQINSNSSDQCLLTKFGEIGEIRGGRVIIKISMRVLPDMLNLREIQFADLVRTAKTELIINTIDLSANAISFAQSNYPLINGDGINISIKEDLYDINDLDLLGKSFHTGLESNTITLHATTMATLIGGKGNSFIKGSGAAPLTKLTSSNFANLFPDSNSNFTKYSISAQNHSYGTAIENYYGAEAVEYDKQISILDSVCHVFSAGNIGNTTPVSGLYNNVPNSANISGTFKQAKNVLVIGGTDVNNIVMPLSSKGPAYDGRIKPDLVADGDDGTSGASALTTGVIALMQNAYKTKYGALPPAALLRSIIINTADDVNGDIIDYAQGFGKLNAFQAIKSVLDGRFFKGSLTKNDGNDFTIAVPDSVDRLKVSLAWNDPPASLNAASALINDLDISVGDPNGNKFLPWCLSSYPSSDSLSKAPVRKRDTLNNIEMVTIDSPHQGIYNVHVNGSKIPNGSQTYFVSYKYDLKNNFVFTSPVKPDKPITNNPFYIRWNNSYNVQSGVLSVSYNKGITWIKIAQVALNDGFYVWTPPIVFKQCLLKMDIGNKSVLSDPFVISTPLNLGVGYNCTDGALLQWNGQTNCIGYNLYNIKNSNLQFIASTTDTALVIPAALKSSNYFAVSAIGPGGFEGVRSLTTDITMQGVGCYVKTLLADVVNGTVRLTLNLGTVFQLKKITWEKEWGVNKFTQLGSTLINTNKLNYIFFDKNIKLGIQYYRVTLEMTDGTKIESDLASAIFISNNEFVVYPIPCTDYLNILSGSTDTYEIDIFDTAGKKVINQTLQGLEQQLYLKNLGAGVYIGVIYIKGLKKYVSKIIKI